MFKTVSLCRTFIDGEWWQRYLFIIWMSFRKRKYHNKNRFCNDEEILETKLIISERKTHQHFVLVRKSPWWWTDRWCDRSKTIHCGHLVQCRRINSLCSQLPEVLTCPGKTKVYPAHLSNFHLYIYLYKSYLLNPQFTWSIQRVLHLINNLNALISDKFS